MFNNYTARTIQVDPESEMWTHLEWQVDSYSSLRSVVERNTVAEINETHVKVLDCPVEDATMDSKFWVIDRGRCRFTYEIKKQWLGGKQEESDDDRPTQEIKVVVTGNAGTGKTAICRVLEDALRKNGIDVKFVDPDTDEVRSWADTQNSIDYIRECLNITIDEQQAGRFKS